MPPRGFNQPRGSRGDWLKNNPQKKPTGPSAKYQSWLQQKANYERQKAAAEAKYKQQQRQAQQAAQARRAQAEQQARIAEQQRRVASERLQKRNDAMRQRRIERHTVKRGDTAETIAGQYGASPQDVAGAVGGALRPGQVINVPTPHEDARMAMQDRTTTTGGGGGPINMAMVNPVAQGGPFSAQILKWGIGALPTVANALNRLSKHIGADYGGPDFPQPQGLMSVTGAIADYTEGGAQALQESTAFKRAIGDEIPQANLARYNEDRRVPGGIHDQIAAKQEQATFDRGNFASMMRYTGQALAYAWEAMRDGDPNWMDYISAQNIKDEYGNDLTGVVTMFLTDGRWDSGPMKEQFTDDMWNKIEEMGFVETAPGFWEIPMILQDDFGMGGFDFPGYGGFGGGGEGYQYLSRGGERRRKSGGGSSSGSTYRIFPEGVPPAHWRI